MTESLPGTNTKRLTIAAHGVAGLLAGLTRYAYAWRNARGQHAMIAYQSYSAFVATPIELVKGESRDTFDVGELRR